MRALAAITGREYASFFRLPLGWIVLALFALCVGAIFCWQVLVPGRPASMREMFSALWFFGVFFAPAISMRLFSEEFKVGTAETLLCAPVGEAALVIGKYFAAVLFYLTLLAPTLVLVLVLMRLSPTMDLGPVLAGYMGLGLLFMLHLAIGTLMSALTASQMLAFFLTLFVLLAIDLVPRLAAPVLPPRIAELIAMIAPSSRAVDFFGGLIDTANVVLLVAASVWFLALAVVALQSRRWR